MRSLISRRLHPADEDGVTLVIVTLCLVALFGMLVLVVDVGGLLLNRREMVNASDAAALSAAKSCILPASQDQYAFPEAAADAYARDNSPRAITSGTNIIKISGCDTRGNGYVQVRYSAAQHLFFAPVLGAGSNGQVTTYATAIFGPSGAAAPLPIVLYEQSFNNCRLNQQVDPTATCYVWEDNNNVNGAQSAFGLLDLRTDDPGKYGWNSVPGADCSAPGNSDVDSWIKTYQNANFPDLPLNYPAPTYVCNVSGFQQGAWADLNQLVDDDDVADNNDEEDILVFPINRCEPAQPFTQQGGQIAGSAQTWNEVACPDTPSQFDIIGFAAMRLIAIYDTNAATGTSGSCASDQTILQGAQNEVYFNVAGLTANNGKSCPTQVPDQFISGPTMTKTQNNGSGPQPTKCPSVPAAGCDYMYANGIITWSRSGPADEGQSFTISFDWQNAGPCGIPPSGNNSGHCLVLQPVEVRIGGSGPGTGSPNSNVRSYKLCEPSISTSCDPVSVQGP